MRSAEWKRGECDMRGEVCGSRDARVYGAAVAEAAAEAARTSRVVRGRLKAGGSIGKC